ncbi:hypothetical protein ACFC0K_16030 [Streptomyces hydrogenans]|uniref:hypothetical protein n=1 Tax=Streptomyces hydrogenans TaxID=1873719 RepID=UPI0035E01043
MDPDKKPYFVIGAWSGGDVDIWHVEEAPIDPTARSLLHDEHSNAADDAFGSVNIVYATSKKAAADQARQEARAVNEQIARDLAHLRAPRLTENPHSAIPAARTRPPARATSRRTAPSSRKDQPWP